MTANPRLEPSQRSKDIRYAIRDVVIEARKQEELGHKILRLNIGDPNAYDFDTPQHIIQGAIEGMKNDHNGYSPSEGIPELRNAISQNERKYGREIGTKDIVVTAGVTEALQMLFANLDGKKVLIPAPSYPPYTTYARFNYVEPIEYPTIEGNNWQPDIDFIRRVLEKDTEKKIAALSIINPNNPTGAVYPEKTVRDMVSVAAEHGLMVISDEIYDLMLYDRDVVKPGRRDNDVPFIIFNGISKVYFAPGWRIGYMAFLDNGELDEFRESIFKQARARLCPNTPCQYGYKAALEAPNHFLEGNIARLKERRDYCVKRIKGIDGLSTRVPEGAFYMFPRIRDGNGNDFKFVIDILKECGVLFVHGSGFSAEYGKGHFRMVFLPELKALEKAFDNIESYMNKNHC